MLSSAINPRSLPSGTVMMKGTWLVVWLEMIKRAVRTHSHAAAVTSLLTGTHAVWGLPVSGLIICSALPWSEVTRRT